ncbi:MAG: flagellar hook-length control protein FliK, partial [Rhodospirillaceae bacterium]
AAASRPQTEKAAAAASRPQTEKAAAAASRPSGEKAAAAASRPSGEKAAAANRAASKAAANRAEDSSVDATSDPSTDTSEDDSNSNKPAGSGETNKSGKSGGRGQFRQVKTAAKSGVPAGSDAVERLNSDNSPGDLAGDSGVGSDELVSSVLDDPLAIATIGLDLVKNQTDVLQIPLGVQVLAIVQTVPAPVAQVADKPGMEIGGKGTTTGLPASNAAAANDVMVLADEAVGHGGSNISKVANGVNGANLSKITNCTNFDKGALVANGEKAPAETITADTITSSTSAAWNEVEENLVAEPNNPAAAIKSFAAAIASASNGTAPAAPQAVGSRASDQEAPVMTAQAVLASAGVGGGAGEDGVGKDGGKDGGGAGDPAGARSSRSAEVIGAAKASDNATVAGAAGGEGIKTTQGQDFARELQSARTVRSGMSAGATDQVSVQLKSSIKDGNSSISMQLRPEELGRIDVKIDIGKDGIVSAMISADRPQTLELLQRDSRTLERALQDAGLHTDSDSLNFGLRGEGGQGFGQAGNRNGGDQPGSGRSGRSHAIADDDAATDVKVVMKRYQVAPGRVDFRI